MRRGRRLPELKLSQEQRSTLQGWTRRRKTAQALSMRARIVLRASDGLTATTIAAEVHACMQTVSKWWRRFDEQEVSILRQSRRLYGCWPLKGAFSQPLKAKARTTANAPRAKPGHTPGIVKLLLPPR